MDIFPSEYQNLELSRYEKVFTRYSLNSEKFGTLLLKINPAMQKNENLHAVINSTGVLFFKFFDQIQADGFNYIVSTLYSTIFKTSTNIIVNKIFGNFIANKEDK